MLATFPGISQISRYDMDRWGDFWRFTDASAGRLFGSIFDSVSVETWGNVFVACASLHGLATDELTPEELSFRDPDYQVVITVRALKGFADQCDGFGCPGLERPWFVVIANATNKLRCFSAMAGIQHAA